MSDALRGDNGSALRDEIRSRRSEYEKNLAITPPQADIWQVRPR